MDIHPHTQHDIARLRIEERLLRAEAAYRAREIGDERPDGSARQPGSTIIHLLHRIGRRNVAEALPHAGTDAV
jgi:hypothetical protein